MNEKRESAIDVALDNNLLQSVKLMIDYIVKHQNSYVYANLFENNFVEMMNKGIEMAPLLKSDIL